MARLSAIGFVKRQRSAVRMLGFLTEPGSATIRVASSDFASRNCRSAGGIRVRSLAVNWDLVLSSLGCPRSVPSTCRVDLARRRAVAGAARIFRRIDGPPLPHQHVDHQSFVAVFQE